MSKIPQRRKRIKAISPQEPVWLKVRIPYEVDRVLERMKYELDSTKQDVVETALREFAKIPEKQRRRCIERPEPVSLVLDSAPAAG